MRLECKVCEGRRYRDDVLKLTYHGRSIHDVLEMTVADALGFFASVEEPRKRSAGIGRGLQLLVDVGVGYLRLGQSLSTLSGGEAQRLKLASELTRSGNLYVMDEPTTGLHPYLSNGGTLEHAQQIAGHASPRTTKLYDRTADIVTLDEIERIVI